MITELLVGGALVLGGILLCVIGYFKRRRARNLLREQHALEAQDSPMEAAAARRLATVFPTASV